MAWTQDQIRALETAYALGVTRVKWPDGTEKEYRSIEDMERILAKMKASQGQGSGSRRRFASYSKGL